jgi:hypothetical protein
MRGRVIALGVTVAVVVLLRPAPSRAAQDGPFDLTLTGRVSFTAVNFVMMSWGFSAAYAPWPFLAFGLERDAFSVAKLDVLYGFPSDFPVDHGEIYTGFAEGRARLLGPLGAFARGSFGTAVLHSRPPADIRFVAADSSRVYGAARITGGPEIRGGHAVLRALAFAETLGADSHPLGIGIEFGATF